jgi:hypothetical protein
MTVEMESNMAKNWIAGAIKHPGSFTKQAKAAGKSVAQFADEKEDSGGLIGKRARLAKTLRSFHKGK